VSNSEKMRQPPNAFAVYPGTWDRRAPDGKSPEPKPADVIISQTTPAPIDNKQLIRDYPVSPPSTGDLPHRLVVLGDSLSHGFKSGAIHDTHLSWPAQVAQAMGLRDNEFRYPTYDGPQECPGLPLNIEAFLKLLEEHTGDHPLLGDRTPLVVAHGLHALAEIKRYWEDGEGSQVPHDARYMHNLAIYGWDVRDALSKDASWCAAHISAPSVFDRWKPHLPHLTVSDNEWRAALRVLVGPQGEVRSQVTIARDLGTEGIDTLIVALGANNALGSVLKVELSWTPDDYLSWAPEECLTKKEAYTVWRPDHFAAEYDELVTEIKRVEARHVVLATVPHVTIAPLLHGFGAKPVGSRYFTRYGRVWIPEDEFDANHDRSLTGDQCRQIDSAIDAYNRTIVDHVVAARKADLDWHIFDICSLLDRLAYRRYLADPSVVNQITPYPLPNALAALSPRPDTRFFGSDRYGRLQGGLIALDGVHPTTIGYGIMAQEVLKVLADAGVVPIGTGIDFEALIAKDTLVSHPPRTLTPDLSVIGFLNEHLDAFKSVMAI
jgi:hypothetical protein